ncbi:HNH endonuclease [Caldimonas sp. KR1-144]|uniref:HNH endonuclease n=1 Tax=Caldimonas sp. KR1-144 TaxID=3400911 RepID=UPI003C103299
MAEKNSTRVLPHTCAICGAVFTPLKFRPSLGVFKAYTGRESCSAECAHIAKGRRTAKRMKETRDQWVGPNNPMWKGSCLRRNKSYRGPDWAQVAESIRKRDGYQCKHCHMTQAEHEARWAQALEVHHKVPFSEFTDYPRANRPANLVTLCKTCHMRADRAIKQRQTLLTFEDEPRKKAREDLVLGSNNPRAKLNESQVAEIKRRLLCREPHRLIAADYGVRKTLISAISTGQNWGHVKANRPA